MYSLRQKIKLSFEKFINLPPEKIFLSLALPFGLLFLFLIPPFQSFDEHSHFFRVFQLKSADIVGERVYPYGAGGYLPTNLIASSMELLDPLSPGEEPHEYRIDLLKKYFNTKPDFNSMTLANIPNTVVYSPIAYLPHILSTAISSGIFNFGVLQILYLARLAGFLVWLIAMFYMIKHIPFGKWALLTIGLIPTMIYEAVTINADTMTTILVFALVTLILYLYKTRDYLKPLDYALLAALCTAVNLAKPGYFIVTALILILAPKVNNKGLKRYIPLVGIAALAIVPFLIWNLIVKDFSVQIPLQFRPGIAINAKDQIHHLVQHPGDLISAFFLTNFTWISSSSTVSFIGAFGWGDYPLPVWMISLGLFLLFFSLIYSSKDEYIYVIKDRFVRKYFLTVALTLFIFLELLLYLTWTPVGARRIDGVQGRYLIPLVALLIPVLQTNVLRLQGDGVLRARIIIGGTLVMLLVSTALLIMRFWI